MFERKLRCVCFNYGAHVLTTECLFETYTPSFFVHSFRISNIHIVGSVGCVIYFSLYVPYSFTYPRDIRFCVPSLHFTHGAVASYICKNVCTCRVPVKNLGKIVNVGKRRRLLTGKLLDGKRG